MDRIDLLAMGIQKAEGFGPGTRSYRNNNPLNVRKSPWMTRQEDGFAVFSTYAVGWSAGVWDLFAKCMGNTVTGLSGASALVELLRVWTDEKDDAIFENYCAVVMEATGATLTTPLSYFLDDLRENEHVHPVT